MATRCTIRIEGFDTAKIYKHWDGYPDGILPWLEIFHTDFLNKRGWDPEYELAQLLRDSVRKAEKYQLDPNHHTGWGIISIDADMGQDYEYVLKKDGSVKY